MTPPALATITFIPAPEDYLAVYAQFTAQTSRSNRRYHRFMLCLASSGATLTSLMIANALTLQSAIVGIIVSLFFIMVFTISIWPDPEKAAKAQYSPAKMPQLYRRRSVQFEASGIRLLTDVSEYWFAWSGVQSVILTEHYLFMVAGSTTVFVPARAFVHPSAFLDFARIAQARYEPQSSTEKTGGFPVILSEKNIGREAEPLNEESPKPPPG